MSQHPCTSGVFNLLQTAPCQILTPHFFFPFSLVLSLYAFEFNGVAVEV